MDLNTNIDLFNDIINRADGDWSNMSYTDKVMLIQISKDLKKEFEGVIEAISPYANIPLEYVEREYIGSLVKLWDKY